MPSALPDGDPAPDRRRAARRPRWQGSGSARSGVYVHVPFCAVRCGYCDFNTYTAAELGPAPAPRRRRTPTPRSARSAWPAGSSATRRRPAATVFVGGGTPTLLPARRARGACWTPSATEFGLAPDAEVTTEANPDSVTPESLQALARGRASPGSRSACSRPSRTCWPPWTAPTTRRGCRQAVAVGRAAGLRAGQPRPDLRHPRRERSPTGRISPATRRWPAGPTTSRPTR